MILRREIFIFHTVDNPQGRPEVVQLHAIGTFDSVCCAACCLRRVHLKKLTYECTLFFFKFGDHLTLLVHLIGQFPVLILEPRNSELVILPVLVHSLAGGPNLCRISVGAFHEAADTLVQVSDVSKIENATLL